MKIWIAALFSATALSGCGGGGGAEAIAPPVNATPLANAGAVQSVLLGSTVTLNGSGSTDTNGDTLTFSWSLTTKPVGSAATLARASSVTPSFLADQAGEYVASLIVNDGKVASVPAAVTVNVAGSNAVPVANAGIAQNVTTGTLIFLNGGASTDANGDALTYSWVLTTRPAGSNATLAGSFSINPSFTADSAGNYVASLIVNDGKDSSSAASVTVTAAVANSSPVANAGAAQTIDAGTVARLNGTSSSDANGDGLTYFWTLTSKPPGSAASLSSQTSPTPTFTADLIGQYLASLRVNDGKVDSAIATTMINAVGRCLNSPGGEANFSYDWSLATQKVTLKNNNSCDSIFIRATSAPIYTNSPNGVIDVRKNIAPGETLVADAVLPASLAWKPSVIYSLPNGKTYLFRPTQAGQATDLTFEILLILNPDTPEGTIAQFNDMFSIDSGENRYGDCQNFTWTDRRNGKYRILPNTITTSGECFVGNIQGITTSGNSVYLPALWYFVTER